MKHFKWSSYPNMYQAQLQFDENYKEMPIMWPLLSYINSNRSFPNQSQFDIKNNTVTPPFFFYKNISIFPTYTWYIVIKIWLGKKMALHCECL